MTEEREVLELDAVIVGAGPSGLACALHLQNLIEAHNRDIDAGSKQGDKLDEVMIAVLEKGAAVGNHILSGAVMDPRGLRELIPDFEAEGCPGIECTKDDVLFLTQKGKKITLVFVWVRSLQQWDLTIGQHPTPGVMPGGHCIKSMSFGIGAENPEFHLPVAHHIRIRGDSVLIPIEKVENDPVVTFRRQIDHPKFNPQRLGDRPGIF